MTFDDQMTFHGFVPSPQTTFEMFGGDSDPHPWMSPDVASVSEMATNHSPDSKTTLKSSVQRSNRFEVEQSRFETGHPLANECLEFITGAEIEKSSAEDYANHLRGFMRFLDEEDILLLNATTRDVERHYRSLARKNLAQGTISFRRTAIERLYKHIRKNTGYEADIDNFLLGEIKISKYNGRERVEREPLTPDQLQMMFDAMDDDRDRLIVLVASEIGARNESLRVLMINDVKLEKREIKVTNTKTGGTYSLPISNEVAMKLERWIKGVLKPDDKFSNGYLFPSIRGGNLKSNNAVLEIVDDAAVKAGIQEIVARREPTKAERENGVEKDTVEFKWITPKLLRFTFSHLLDEAGLSTKERRDALDHESVETTEKYYTHNRSDHKRLIRSLFDREGALSS